MSLSTDISIINSFKEVAKEKGVNHVTIGNIADRCGCARQTVYYHFDGTIDLIKWITQNELAGLTFDCMDQAPWKSEIYRILTALKENQWLFEDIFRSKYWFEYSEFLMEIIQTNVISQFFINITSYGSDKNRENLARMLTYTFVGNIIDWIKGGFVDTPQEITEDMARLCGSSMHQLIEDFLTLRPQNHSATAN